MLHCFRTNLHSLPFVGAILLFATVGCKDNRPLVSAPRKVHQQVPLRNLDRDKIFDELKGKIKLESLWPPKENEPKEFEWPSDTDRELRECIERFEAEPKLTTVYSLPVNRVRTRTSVDMSGDGKLLYIVDSDNMVEVIDIESGTSKRKFAAPIEDAYGILVDVSGEHVFLLNRFKFVKVHLDSEKIVQTIDNMPDTVTELTRALASDDIAAVTSGSEIMVVEQGFEGFELIPNIFTRAQHVAVHPEGKYIAGSDDGHLFRWHIKEEPHRLEFVPGEEFTFSYMPVTSDYDADRWIDLLSMHEHAGKLHSGPVTTANRVMPLVIDLLVVDAISCSNGDNSWVTVVGKVVDGTDTSKCVVASMSWYPNAYPYQSSLIQVEAKYINRMWANRRGDRVAFYTDTDIRVCDRPYFDDPQGEAVLYPLAKMVNRNQIAHVEQVAKYFRSKNYPDKASSGEEIYGHLITLVSRQWYLAEQNAEKDDGARETLTRLEAWKATGNEMALAASANRHIHAGHEARGGDWAVNVTAEGWAELERRVELAMQDLDQVLAMEKPPAIAFRYYVNAAMLGKETIQDGFERVKRCISLYPEYLDIHSPMSNWLLPRWGGYSGAIDAYCSKIASLYPEAMQDMVYCILMIDGIDYIEHKPLFEEGEANADVERMYRGAQMLREQNRLAPFQCEAIARIAKELGDDVKEKEYLDYHLSHFVTPSIQAHSHQSRNQLLMYKRQLLTKALRPKK